MKIIGRYLVAVILVTIVWLGLDFSLWFGLEAVFYKYDFQPIYREITEAIRQGGTSPLDHARGVLIVSSIFVAIYQWMINPKQLSICIAYSFLFGLMVKIDGGALAYTYTLISDPTMLIRISIAGIEGIIGGLILSAVIKE